MNEDQITQALINALRTCGPGATRRFIRDVVGMEPGNGHLEYWDNPRAAWQPPDGPPRGLVLGLAASTMVKTSDERGAGWGEGKIDAAIWDSSLLLAIETKVRGGVLTAAQMTRHAHVAALQVPDDGLNWADDGVPDGFALATWAHVAGWLGRELSASDHRFDGVAQHLADILRDEGICTADQSIPPTHEVARTLPRTQRPEHTPIAEIRAEWDLAQVRRICLETYGGELIKADCCVDDTRRIRSAFEAVSRKVPTGILVPPHDGAMTPERVLSVLYGYTGKARASLLSNAYPDSWTAMKMRTVGSGGDRHLLAAMIAWALMPGQAPAASKRILEHVPRLWASAPGESPGSERLHRVLAAARRPGARF